MSRLDGFEVYTRKADGNIFISVTSYGVAFSKASVASLNFPGHVHVLFDKNANMAISPCEKDTTSRVFVKNPDSDRAGFVRWNDKRLIKHMIELADLNIGSKGIRIKGEYFADENILIYNLKDYTQINRSDDN